MRSEIAPTLRGFFFLKERSGRRGHRAFLLRGGKLEEVEDDDDESLMGLGMARINEKAC